MWWFFNTRWLHGSSCAFHPQHTFLYALVWCTYVVNCTPAYTIQERKHKIYLDPFELSKLFYWNCPQCFLWFSRCLKEQAICMPEIFEVALLRVSRIKCESIMKARENSMLEWWISERIKMNNALQLHFHLLLYRQLWY